MKQKNIFLFLALLCYETATFAQSFYVDGINYESTSSKTVSVRQGPNYSGDIVIPSTVIYNNKSYSVTGISSSAFLNCTKLKSIIIPNSVEDIGVDAFSGCEELQSVTLPNSITIIDNGVFRNCKALKSIQIPKSVTRIEYYAFKGCI